MKKILTFIISTVLLFAIYITLIDPIIFGKLIEKRSPFADIREKIASIVNSGSDGDEDNSETVGGSAGGGGSIVTPSNGIDYVYYTQDKSVTGLTGACLLTSFAMLITNAGRIVGTPKEYGPVDVYLANKTIKAAEAAVKTEDDKQKKIVDAATAAADKQKDLAEELRVAMLDEQSKELDALNKKYNEYITTFKNDEEKKLQINEWYYNERLKIAVKYIDKEIDEEERLVKEVAEKQKLLDATSREKITTKFAEIDKDAEKQLYTAEREKTATTSPWGDIDTEIAKLENVKSITQQILTSKLDAIDTELKAVEISEERRAELLAQRVVLEETTKQQLDQLNAQYEAQQKKRTQTIASFSVQAFTQALAGASQLISALQANIDTTTEEGFEKSKEMQKANVWINTASGILSAIASAWQLGPIAGAIVGSINAAFTLATGIAQIANINKQKFDSASAIGGSSSTPSVTPYINQSLPVTYTRNVQSNSETENLNQPIRAYVVESDLNDAQKREMARQQNSEF
jgi:hypothetical protein